MRADYIEYLTWDEQANAAYLALRQNNSGDRYAARTLPVPDENGSVVAALDFGADGELIGIELLNANSQLSAALKAAARPHGSPS